MDSQSRRKKWKMESRVFGGLNRLKEISTAAIHILSFGIEFISSV